MGFRDMFIPLMKKTAAGDSQTFESSLASIGRATMASKAPALFKHEVGFQILDSDDDNTRAVGVFGFRVGGRIIYAPLFYRDGTVKGTEQLRDPKNKLTVPLSDNWVNKLLSDKKNDKDAKRISKSNYRGSHQPSLWQLKYPPTKYATDTTWLPECKKAIARVIGTRPTFPAGDGVDLLKIASEDPNVFDVLCRTAVKYPWFGDAVIKFHGREKFASYVELMEKKARQPKPRFKPNLTTIPAAPKKQAGVITIRVRSVNLSAAPISSNLDYLPDELAELKAGRNVYHDNRDESKTTKIVTWLGGEQADGYHVDNPTSPGIYKVLGADWKAYECAVMFPLAGWEPNDGMCLIVRLSDKAHAYVHRNNVWTVGEAEPGKLAEWVNEQAKPTGDANKKLPEMDGKFVGLAAINHQNVDCTVPLSYNNPDTGEVYESCGCGGYNKKPPYWNTTVTPQVRTPYMPRVDRMENAPKRIRVWDKPGRITRSANCIYLPSNCRYVKLGDSFDIASGSDPEKFLMREKKAAEEKAATVRVITGDLGVGVEDPRTRTRRWFPDLNEAEAHLVEDHHFKVADARRLVALTERGPAAVAVKYAEMGLSQNYPNAPAVNMDEMQAPEGFADDVLPTMTSYMRTQPVDDLLMRPDTMDRYRPYPTTHGILGPVDGIGNNPSQSVESAESVSDESGPTEKDLQTVAAAAETGQKELFDTSALAALVKHTSLKRLLDQCNPLISKTLSSIGDMLAHMYWNVDEWEEQFGRTEVGPLEDQMRDLFDGLGELYLTLQEKRVGDPREYGILPDEYDGDASDSKM